MNNIITIFAIFILIVCAAAILLAFYRQYISLVYSKHIHEKHKEILSEKITQLSNPVNKLNNQSSEIAWDGFRKFSLKAKVLESEEVCSFYFVPHDKKPLPPFIPGQHLTFRLNLPEVSFPVIRCYSLSDSPTHPDYYRVTIKNIISKISHSKNKSGLVSNHFYKTLQVNDIVDVKAPAGNFHLDTERMSPVVLIAGGIGVTPMISMINYIVSTRLNREVWFFYGVHNSTRHLMIDYLDEIGKENPNIHINICYSEPLERDFQREGYHLNKRVTVALIKKILPSNNYDYYICGPGSMMKSMIHDLLKWGVPEDKIHSEAFGSSSVRRLVNTEASMLPQNKGVAIKFAKSGISLKWDGESTSLLDFAENSGVPIETGCRSGNCGTCRVAIRSGEINYITSPGVTVDDGSCLTCIAIPKTELVLDA